jgi:hypothetical protein
MLQAVRTRYSEFLSHNPTANLVELEVGGAPRAIILDPWSDPSIALVVPDQNEVAFYEAL